MRAEVARTLARLAPPAPAELVAAGAAALPLDQGRLLEALAACAPAGRALLLGVPAAEPWVRRGSRGGELVVRDGAASALEELTGPFHLAVLDAAPSARRRVDRLLPSLAVGGRVAVLGALRDLTDPEAAPAELASLRPYLLIHPQLAVALLPVGDGVLVAVKRRETIRELGGPY